MQSIPQAPILQASILTLSIAAALEASHAFWAAENLFTLGCFDTIPVVWDCSVA